MKLPTVVPPKAPRWITTDEGRWAWHELAEWRERASLALSVSERAHLLAEAEQAHQAGNVAA